MEMLHVRPARIRQFGAPEGATFCLVSNPELIDAIAVDEADAYAGVMKIPFAEGDSFGDLLESRIPERAHVLVISPAAFFQSPPQESLGPGRKLLAMACNSTPTPWESLAHFMRVIEDTDPAVQQRFTDRFFELGQRARYLELVDERHGTRARFDHMDERYLWNEQTGGLGWGEQQIAPSGEISVLPLHIWDFDSQLFLDMNGTIALQGYPILHCGTPSFLRADQARIHERLSALERGALIASVERGQIVDLRAAEPAAAPALEMMNAMFAVDSRYRIIWELGFAINTSSRIVPGNLAMNEVYGAQNGTVHFGLGLTPYTQYHLDIICPGTVVFTDRHELLHGGERAQEPAACGAGMARRRVEGCPCLE